MPGVRALRKDVQVAAGATVSLDLVLEAVTLEAVTVTAMLREQEIQDVPFSIAAATATVLRARGADNIEAIAANVADFSVQNPRPGPTQPPLPGVPSGPRPRAPPR